MNSDWISTTFRYNASLRLSVSSATFRSVISRIDSIAPTVLPFESYRGEAVNQSEAPSPL